MWLGDANQEEMSTSGLELLFQGLLAFPLRFMEDRLRVKEVSVEKLRLKNTSIKAQIVKMEQQLQQKEEMGEVLNVIDFDQLKIENQQYLEKIEERNNELLRMKLSTGRTIQASNGPIPPTSYAQTPTPFKLTTPLVLDARSLTA